MKTYSISEHWDTGAVITAYSNPSEEYAKWQAHAAANPSDWRGDEFTLEDFERHIEECAEQGMQTYRYATDSDFGGVEAESLQAAYASLRAKITDEMIADGATLWVEDDNGKRITMGKGGAL